ncbi:MAG TPA: aldo/keto reductase [Pirellulales bacterium]
MKEPFDLRPLGATGMQVSVVALGCWPIAGMTSLDVNEADSRATVHAALDAGVNFFDTAYCYGLDGESERLIGPILQPVRERVVIATKGGIHWGPDRKQVKDARPATLRRECEVSLARLGVDAVDLLYLHAPDPATPIAESAGELKRLLDEGKTRSVGASNCSLAQLEEFARECPLAACQPHYNLLQREIEAELLPWCAQRSVSVMIYWPLLKGLLAGKLPRDFVFKPGDGRAKYPMFQGAEWVRNQDFLDKLRPIAEREGMTLAELSVNWTLCRSGVTSALCGAKRPDQILDTAGAMGRRLSPAALAAIETAYQERGPAVSQAAVSS